MLLMNFFKKFLAFKNRQYVIDGVQYVNSYRIKDALNIPHLQDTWKNGPHKGLLLVSPTDFDAMGIVKELATKTATKIFYINAIDITSMRYLHRVIGSIEAVFGLAKKENQSVIFIENIDFLSWNRNGATSVILTSLDELSPNVRVIASTNHPDEVDPGFRRPGRIDLAFYVPSNE